MDTTNWKWFRYDEIFDIKGSKTTPIEDLEAYGKGDFPYVTTQAVNNGVEGFYNYSTEKGGVLTVDSAVLGFCSYQEKDFSASDHVEILRPKFSMNKYIALFLTTIINREQYKYSYGRKCSQVKLRRSRIKLPVTPEGAPDWQFMENCIKSLPYSKNIAPSQPNEIIDEMMEVKKEIISLRKQLQSQHAAQVVNY
ncbi:MAG: restriction endonuclease subunit S, partial [Paludibacteraceae bacterium]|nr:restriction endonuclease subunit S [Paludibacteraceae bacterium]